MFYYQSGCGTQAFLVFHCTERNPYGIYAVIPSFIFAKVQGGDYLGKLLDFIASAFIYLCGLYGRRLVFCGHVVGDPGILRSFSALYTSQPAASGKSVSA